jgi:hypothetical protein
MIKKITLSYKTSIIVLLLLIAFPIVSYSQTSEVIVTVNWPAWSGENKVEIYNPSGTLLIVIDDRYDGSSGGYSPGAFNLSCLPDDLNSPSGTGYYAIVYERYGDGWNSGGTLNITSGGVSVLSYNGNTGTLNNGGNGEITETLYFQVTNGGAACTPACTPVIVAPTAVSASPSTILEGNSTNLNATSAGNTINWYTVSSGGTSLGSSASGANFSISPSTTTTYYAESDDGSCPSATRTPVTVAVISYCPSYGNGNNFGIRSVDFNSISNATSSNSSSYSDYTSISTDVTQGNSYNLSVNVNTNGYYWAYTYAWIDWNQDGIFSDSERYNLGTRRGTSNGSTSNSPLSITVPTTAAVGATRMRVSTRYNGYPDSCDTDSNFYGEVEDYSVNVISACSTYSLTNTAIVTTPICAGTAATVRLTGTAANLPTGSYTVTYNLSGTNTATGNTATMTVSTAGTGTFTTSNLANSGATTVTITNLTKGTCSSTISANRTAIVTVLAAPTITSTTPGSREGTGIVTLGATASSGTISWYAALTGGTALATGNTYAPSISATTTYYVEADNGTCTSSPRTAVTATVLAPTQHTIYYENFDENNGTWTMSNTGTGSVWAHGTGLASSSENAEGSYWYTNNYNNYADNSYTYAESPILSSVGYNNLIFSADVRYNLDNDDDDGMIVQYRKRTAGVWSTWTILGSDSSGGTNWYDGNNIVDAIAAGSDGWTGNTGSTGDSAIDNDNFFKTATHILPTILENSTEFQVRFVFASDGTTTDDGAAFDNILIYGIPIALAQPISGPGSINNNLKLWLNASAEVGLATNGSNITNWRDQAYIDLPNNAIGLTSNSPSFEDNSTENINFNPVIKFDRASKEYLRGKGGYFSHDYFVVIKSNNTIDMVIVT